MAAIKFSVAFFWGIFFETLLVGIFIPLLIAASYAQWKKVSMGRELNRIMVFTTVFCGLSVTTVWILGLRRALIAALYLPPGVTMDKYLAPPLPPTEVARKGVFLFQIMVADVIMVYRMYHIYGKSRLACAIPSITTVGLLVIGCGLTNQLRHLRTPEDLTVSDNWTAACYCVTLFNSVFMCVAISLRLWKVHREAVKAGIARKDSLILRAIKVIVESAALWTLSVSLNFLSFLAKSNLRFTFLMLTSPTVGISFCLIIVRLGVASPELHEEYWGNTQPDRTSKMFPVSNSRLSSLPVHLDRVKVERDVTVSESESGITQLRTINSTSPMEKQTPVHGLE